MGENDKITPFRMQALIEIAAKIVKIMVTGVWHLSFEEIDMVLGLVQHGMNEARERNKKGEQNISEDNGTKKDYDGQPETAERQLPY